MSVDYGAVAEKIDGAWEWRADLRASVDAPRRTRVVEIPMAPPRRLMQSLRFRSSKIRYDQDVWQQCMQPVLALLLDGWQVVRVHVEWGRRVPETPALRERVARELTECGSACELVQTQSRPGKGETMITLKEGTAPWTND